MSSLHAEFEALKARLAAVESELKSRGLLEEVAAQASEDAAALAANAERPPLAVPIEPAKDGVRITLVEAGRNPAGERLVDVLVDKVDKDLDWFTSYQFKVHVDHPAVNFVGHDEAFPSLGNTKGWVNASRDTSDRVGGFASALHALNTSGTLERLRFVVESGAVGQAVVSLSMLALNFNGRFIPVEAPAPVTLTL